MDKFSIVLMNQITGQNHAFEIDSLNYMCTTMLGGTGGHTYIVPALKEICSLLGYSTAGNFTIELLNTICTGGGGTGGHTYEYEAWYEIQQGSLLNLLPSIQAKLLFWGKYSDISDSKMPNKLGTDWISVSGSARSETYQCPDTSDYTSADTDYIWFKTDGDLKSATTEDLIAYDFARTIIKYDDDSPNYIREIAILKSGETLTATERDNLFKYFHLPVLWDNNLNAFGHIKSNRIGYTPYFDYYSLNLFERGEALGETQTSARKTAIDTAIKSLRAASLFETKFDCFYVTKGTGVASTKLNWVKTTHALTKGGAGTLNFTNDAGYVSDGTTYLDTNYIPSSDAVRMSLNNASFGRKISGTVGTGVRGSGVSSSTGGNKGITIMSSTTTSYMHINDWTAPDDPTYRVYEGYTCLSRQNATQFEANIGTSNKTFTSNSVGLPLASIKLLAVDEVGTMKYFEAIAIELVFIGGYISQTQYDTIKSIIDTLFSSY